MPIQGGHAVRNATMMLLFSVLALTLALFAPVLAQTPVPSPAPTPAAPAAAAPAAPAPPKIDSGDAAGVRVSSALVLLMTAPGLALFYGGMVRQKNALGTLMQSFIILALISVQWVLWGYSLAFGPDKGGIIGGLEWVGLKGVGQTPNADYAATIPHQAFMLFQMMFAVITPALITGAFAERKKFSTFLVFILVWATVVYDPLAHWVWGMGGWLRNLGALDFAGGTVVHHSSGLSAPAPPPDHRQAPGVRPSADAPPQSAVHGDGSEPALVRLVRIQRRQRAGRERPRRARLHDHQHRHRGCCARLDVHRVVVAGEAHRAGGGLRGGGGSRGDHTPGRLRDPNGVDRDRRGGRRALLHRLQPEVEAGLRRFARRGRRARRRRHVGRPGHRCLRHQARERRGRRRTAVRQPQAAGRPVRRGARDLGARVRDDHDHPEGS